jgi:hypothetical protein
MMIDERVMTNEICSTFLYKYASIIKYKIWYLYYTDNQQLISTSAYHLISTSTYLIFLLINNYSLINIHYPL